jgi:hypothetical protein
LKEVIGVHNLTCSVFINPETLETQPKTTQLKIIPFDPREILRIQNEQRIQLQTQLIPDRPDFLQPSKPAEDFMSGTRDILREAAEHILNEDQPQKVHHGGVVISVGAQQLPLQNPAGIVIGAGIQKPQQDVLISSPGFVRVTPNYISVKSPLVKKAQKVKKTLS